MSVGTFSFGQNNVGIGTTTPDMSLQCDHKSTFYKYLERIEQYVFENIDRLGYSADYPCRNFMELHPEFDKNKLFYVYNGLSLDPLKKNLANFEKLLRKY